MRKVILYELLSLDGVAEAPETFFIDWDDAMDAALAAVIETQDSVILGRRSYDEWSQFWPGSEIEPFATFIKRCGCSAGCILLSTCRVFPGSNPDR